MDLSGLPDDISRDESTNVLSVSSDFQKISYGIGYELFKSMQQHKHKVAQYIAETGETDSYEDLLKRSVRTALHLKSRNLKKDDIVCFSSYNHRDSSVPFIACLFLGIKVSSLDPTFTVGDATHLIKTVKPKMFFIVPEVIDTIETSIRNAGIDAEVVVYGEDVDTAKFTPFDNFLEEHEDEDTFTPIKIEDVSETAVIFFSSGSTGLPKGICSSHKVLYHQGSMLIHLGLLRPDTVLMIFSTLYWVSAVVHLIGCAIEGSARLVCKKYEPNKLWFLLDKYKVTYCFFAPIQAYSMVSDGRPADIDTSHLLVVVTGGTIFSIESLQKLRDLLPGTLVFQGYGCTEITGTGMLFNVTKAKDKLLLNYRPSSCGRPVRGFDYKVVDPETEKNCGPNEKGELRIRSEFILNGYYNQDSSSAYDSEGWLSTGDMVYYDEEFCFYVVGRIKEILKYKSWHVPPATIEEVLQTHPAVKQGVVIGIPHEIDGDHPMALIILKENYNAKVTPDEIENFVAERVNDTHKLRAGVKFIETLPLTPSGKIKKLALRDMVLQNLI